MPLAVIYAVGAISAYLIGSVPFGVLVARTRGIDLRAVGSGNIGAANVSRALGPRWGAFVLLLDLLKGFIPACAALLFAHRLRGADGISPQAPLLGALVGLGAILGHTFTIFLKFRGGKGVATCAGVFLALSPEAIFVCAGIYVGARVVFKYFSLASILAAATLPLAATFLPKWIDHGRAFDPHGALPITALAALAAVIVIIRHRTNIVRLLNGTEPKHMTAANARQSPTPDRPEHPDPKRES